MSKRAPLDSWASEKQNLNQNRIEKDIVGKKKISEVGEKEVWKNHASFFVSCQYALSHACFLFRLLSMFFCSCSWPRRNTRERN